MKRAVLILALAVAACNDSDLSKSSIPPIAGIVGGPDQPNGNGNVAMELSTAEASVEPGSTITVRNLTRGEVEPVDVIANEAQTYALIRADVGDELRVTFVHPTLGQDATDFLVQSPQITRIDSGVEGTAGVVTSGGTMRLQGNGFCHSEVCNRLVIDDNPAELALHGEQRPGEIAFTLGTNSGLAEGTTHMVRIRVAGAGDDPHYLSNAYEIMIAPSE